MKASYLTYITGSAVHKESRNNGWKLFVQMVLDLVLKEISSDKPYKRTNDLIRAGRHVIPDSSSFQTLIKNGKPVFIPDNHWVLGENFWLSTDFSVLLEILILKFGMNVFEEG